MARKQIGSVQKTKEENLRYNAKDAEGNVIKDKDGKVVKIKEFYIKITEDVTLKKGDYVNLENKQLKLASLEANGGKMSEEAYEKALKKINDMPDFVQFELIRVTKD